MEREQLTEQWIEYDGDYCKAIQEIRMKDGREIPECWPDAGEWASLLTGRTYCNDAVTHVRLAKPELPASLPELLG